MALRVLKPTTATRRHTVVVDRGHLNKAKKNRSLMRHIKYKSGHNFQGRYTVRHKGGREKRTYREIDFIRAKRNIEGKVESLEFDPNRTAFIALVLYKDGDRKYIIASKDMKVGDTVIAGENIDIKEGYALPVGKIPSGTLVYNVQLNPKTDAVMVRSAGSSAQVMGESGKYIQIKLPSGELRLVESICYATVGQVSNTDHMNERIGSAGRRRHMGIRPTVRGVAQHADSHPHGGGQGKGGRHGTGGPAVDPWGHKKGKKTRNNSRTNKYIVLDRRKKV